MQQTNECGPTYIQCQWMLQTTTAIHNALHDRHDIVPHVRIRESHWLRAGRATFRSIAQKFCGRAVDRTCCTFPHS
jgi:hypothetical protein